MGRVERAAVRCTRGKAAQHSDGDAVRIGNASEPCSAKAIAMRAGPIGHTGETLVPSASKRGRRRKPTGLWCVLAAKRGAEAGYEDRSCSDIQSVRAVFSRCVDRVRGAGVPRASRREGWEHPRSLRYRHRRVICVRSHGCDNSSDPAAPAHAHILSSDGIT